MELSIVIPTYNERENIRELIPRLETAVKKENIDFEIIIVDDNSPDKTGEAADLLNKKYGNVVSIVRKDVRGIASAWFHGYKLAKGDYVATMDADLCHSPEDLLRMYHATKGFDIVIGSRYMKGGSGMKDKSIVHIWASSLAQKIINWLIGVNETDVTHSFRIYKREVFKSIKTDLRTSGNVFLVLFIYLAKKKGYKVKEVPITYGKRLHGQTKMNLYKEGFKFMLTAFKIFIKDNIIR